jgi:hypothetical protein
MIHTETIENTRGNIKLVRIIYDFGNGECWIEFNGLKDEDYPSHDVFWDNDNFIFINFYKFLKRLKKGKLKKKDRENFNNVWPILTDDTVIELIKMLEFAIEKEWYRFALPTVSLSGPGTTITGITTTICNGYISTSPDGICSKCGKPEWNHPSYT